MHECNGGSLMPSRESRLLGLVVVSLMLTRPYADKTVDIGYFHFFVVNLNEQNILANSPRRDLQKESHQSFSVVLD